MKTSVHYFHSVPTIVRSDARPKSENATTAPARRTTGAFGQAAARKASMMLEEEEGEDDEEEDEGGDDDEHDVDWDADGVSTSECCR